MMLGTWFSQQVAFDGLVQGFVYGLLAMAIVLVYRSTKVINFAAGNMGLIGAGLLVLCNVNYDIPFWPSLLIAIVAGTAFGAVIELVVVRRLFRAPRVIMLVATIGVAQLALVILSSYPDVVGERLPFPVALGSSWQFGDVQVRGPQVAILVVAPAMALALGWFLNRTLVGRTVRAAAGDPDLARLSGISPKLLSTLVWSVAGLLSTVAIILRTGVDGTTMGLQTVGAATLLRALIAAVIARLDSFRTALITAVAIGVGESLIRFNFLMQPGLAEVVLLVVALIAVSRQPGGRGRAEVSSAFAFVPRVQPLPDRLRSVWWIRHLDRFALLAVLAVAIVAPLVFTQPSQHILYATIAAFGICALSLTVLTGWAGQLSLGQMALAGVSALTGAAFARGLLVDWVVAGRQVLFFELYAVPFVVSLALGALASTVAAVVIGGGALRVRGLLLAISTFAFAIAATTWLFRLELFSGGNTGSVPYRRGDLFGLDLDDQRSYYYLCLAVLVIVVALLGRLRRSGVGRVTLAVRDNADSAAAYTVSPTVVKLRAFALSGFVAGLGGALLAGARQQIPFANSFFSVDFSLSLVAMIVIGGMASTAGGVIGAVWVIGLPALFPGIDIFALLASSVGLLVLLLYFPGGLVNIAHRARGALYAWMEAKLPPVEKQSAAPPPAIGSRRRAVSSDVEVALRCRDMTVDFGGHRANDRVSIEVRSEEIVGLIGTNGAGKTTLMNAIGGYVPARGTVELLGEDVVGRSPAHRARQGLGRTFQSATLFPELTVLETVQVALEARGRTNLLEVTFFSPRATGSERRKRSEASDLVDFLGLGRYADKPIAQLSTGTRRIIELACLLALDARVLCLDEPTAGVAQREAEAMGPLLVQIRRELGAAMLVIEHDMPLIMGMSDRVYCLELGRVIAEGDPVTVRNSPEVIASYLGTDERTIARSGQAADNRSRAPEVGSARGS